MKVKPVLKDICCLSEATESGANQYFLRIHCLLKLLNQVKSVTRKYAAFPKLQNQVKPKIQIYAAHSMLRNHT